jgi:hypothetical protein
MDVDRNRLLHQLDKVCEEKDEEIKQLKGLLYEKNVEFDHQMNLAKEGKKGLHDEIQDLKNMMAFQKAAAENDVHQLASEKAQLSRCSHSLLLLLLLLPPSLLLLVVLSYRFAHHEEQLLRFPPCDLHTDCQNINGISRS